MIKPAIPSNEAERLKDLHSYKVLDSKNEDEFDMLVELASRVCEAPISLITLVDSERQWFKAKIGIEQSESDRGISFCAHAILQHDLFVVNDTTKDERFHDNPFVTGDPSIRFYAGAQLRSKNGHKLGTLCVLDNKPRELNWHQASALRILSQQVSRLLELRYYKLPENIGLLPENVLDKQLELQQIITAQTEHYSNSQEPLLQPLKTGQFNKKELTRIYELSAKLITTNKRFHTLLALYYQQYKRNDSTESQTLSLKTLVENIAASLAEKSEKRLPELSFELNADNFSPKEDAIAEQCLHHITEILLTDIEEDIHIESLRVANRIELRFHIAKKHLADYFFNASDIHEKYGALTGQACFSLQLLKLLIEASKGSMEVVDTANGCSLLVSFALH